MQIWTRRIYDPSTPQDGRRVLVDRLWPRGVARADARIDAWLKGIAPSDGLRRWYGHDPQRWDEFRRRYAAELDHAGEALDQLRDWTAQGRVTLVYAARDERRNNAVALREYLQQGGRESS
ncbi:MAG TPA: DUF488 family protein [Thioalkalivibrio sp.]|nr:DUF488 family protein [Thioalkalivibrio sp.]